MKLYDDQGRLHGQPAIVGEGYQAFYEHGKLHNLNGPAVVTPERIAHYIEGVLVSEFHLIEGNWVSQQIKPVAAPYQSQQTPKKARKLLTEVVDDGN